MQEFLQDYVEMWQKWSDFEGQSTRRNFWMAMLVHFLISIVFGGILNVLGLNFVIYIYSVLVIIPSISIGMRRLHNINKSGLNILWCLVPFGIFYVIYLWIQE